MKFAKILFTICFGLFALVVQVDVIGEFFGVSIFGVVPSIVETMGLMPSLEPAPFPSWEGLFWIGFPVFLFFGLLIGLGWAIHPVKAERGNR